MTTAKGNLSVRTIWGKVVLYLKEHRQVALHVACGDITDVKLEDGKLVINVTERVLAGLLTEGKSEIERALRWQGLDMEAVIVIKEIESSEGERDIKKLNEVFDNVTVVEKKTKIIWR